MSTCGDGGDCLLMYWQPGLLGYDTVQEGESLGIEPGVATPAEQIVFAPETSEALASASLWETQRTAGALLEQPSETSSPERDAASDTHGVVITGVVQVSFDGGEGSVDLVPGSYYLAPAGVALASTCKQGPCRLLEVHPTP